MTIEAIGTEQKLITRWLSHRPVRDVTCNSPNTHYRYVASMFRIRIVNIDEGFLHEPMRMTHSPH